MLEQLQEIDLRIDTLKNSQAGLHGELNGIEQGLVAAREEVAGLELKVAELEDAAQEASRQIEDQVAGSEEVAALVHALEEQYDAFTRGIGRAGLLAATDLPTAEELGAEFERFLAEQRPDES